MKTIDSAIFIAYLIGLLAVGYYFFKKNRDAEDYYVGGRSISAGPIRLAYFPTDPTTDRGALTWMPSSD